MTKGGDREQLIEQHNKVNTDSNHEDIFSGDEQEYTSPTTGKKKGRFADVVSFADFSPLLLHR